MIDSSKQLNKSKPIVLEKHAALPAGEANMLKVFPMEVEGVIELFAIKPDNTAVQLTKGGSVNLPQLPSLVPTGGAKNSLLVKQSAVDHATAWKTISTLQKEMAIPLAVGNTLALRLAGLNMTGIEVTTANEVAPVETEFGTDIKTLVIALTGEGNIIPAEVILLEKTGTGTVQSQGWYPKAMPAYKGNSAKTKCALPLFLDLLDPAKEYLLYVRFITPLMS